MYPCAIWGEGSLNICTYSASRGLRQIQSHDSSRQERAKHEAKGRSSMDDWWGSAHAPLLLRWAWKYIHKHINTFSRMHSATNRCFAPLLVVCKMWYVKRTWLHWSVQHFCKTKTYSCPCNGSWKSTGCETSRLPNFPENRFTQRWRWGCQPYAPAKLYLPRKIPRKNKYKK
jgi:hypothetical protein